MKHTYDKKFEAHLGLTGNRRCLVPDQVANNQYDYDGRSFFAIEIPVYGSLQCKSPRKIRVRLIGDDYGLHSTGTGDMTVRPVSICH